LYKPKSVVDIGCGIGLYLAEFQNLGVRIQGFDFSEDAKSNCAIDPEFFSVVDLIHPIANSEKFDMCICSEVGEHIPDSGADNLIETIEKFSNLIIFSAAHPGQGGTNHVNEKPQEYWISKFAGKGYTFQKKNRDDLRKRIAGLKSFRKSNCLYMNLMVFSK
jgi:SAM-dependent methyltransferase